MATDFSNKTVMSRPLTVGTKKNNDMPLDVRTRLETMDEIAKVEYPFIGMLFYVKETGKYYSVKTLKSEELIPGIPATAVENYRIGDYEEFEADSSTEEDILVSGVEALGGLIEGQVIPAGTSFTDFLKMLLQKPEYFEYHIPEVSIKLDPSELELEVGTIVNPKINYEFTRKDGGEIEVVSFGPKNTVQQEQAVILDEGNVEYTVVVGYFKGEQKYDDFGNPSGKPLPSGKVGAKASYKGFRYFFFGADDKNVPFETSEEVRSLERTREDEFTIVVPKGSQRVMVAVPANGKQPVSIDYGEQGNAEYKDNFVPNVVSVSGATPNENMMDYNVYTFMFLIPCGAEMTFKVKLG